MTNFNCVNCGSDNIKILRNDDFITSKGGYQELIKLKTQKEKQLQETTNTITIQEVGKKIKGKTNIVHHIGIFMISIFWFCLSYASLFFIGFNLFFMLINIITAIIVIYYLFQIIKIIIYFIKIPYWIINNEKRISRYQGEIKKINKKVETWLNLYYCHDCNQVMDLESQLSDYPENINSLVYQLYNK